MRSNALYPPLAPLGHSFPLLPSGANWGCFQRGEILPSSRGNKGNSGLKSCIPPIPTNVVLHSPMGFMCHNDKTPAQRGQMFIPRLGLCHLAGETSISATCPHEGVVYSGVAVGQRMSGDRSPSFTTESNARDATARVCERKGAVHQRLEGLPETLVDIPPASDDDNGHRPRSSPIQQRSRF